MLKTENELSNSLTYERRKYIFVYFGEYHKPLFIDYYLDYIPRKHDRLVYNDQKIIVTTVLISPQSNDFRIECVVTENYLKENTIRKLKEAGFLEHEEYIKE